MVEGYIDFETDGLFGPIESWARVQNDGTVQCGRKEGLEAVLTLHDSSAYLVVWSHWHMNYIREHYAEQFGDLRDHIICLSDLAYPLIGKRRITDITETMLQRNHMGESRQDAMDLMECYGKLSMMGLEAQSDMISTRDFECCLREALYIARMSRDSSMGKDKNRWRKISDKLEDFIRTLEAK